MMMSLPFFSHDKGWYPALPHCQGNPFGARLLQIEPDHLMARNAAMWDGMDADVVQALTDDPLEIRFQAERHLLLVYQEGVRKDGETFVDGKRRSAVRALKRKLTFVPVNSEFCERQRPRIKSRIICFYFDSGKMPALGVRPVHFGSRVLFESNPVWESAVKVAAAMEEGPEAERYAEALGVVIGYELLRNSENFELHGLPAKGGLAACTGEPLRTM